MPDVTVVPDTRATRPLIVAYGLIFVVAGVAAAISGLLLAALGGLIGWSVIAAVVIGGGLIAAGGVWGGVEHIARAVERAGHYVAGAGWASFALIYGAEYGLDASANVLQAVVLTGGCIARAQALRRVDRAVETAEAARKEEQ